MPGRVAAEFGGAVVLVCRRHSRPCACLVARRRKRGHGEARPRGGEVNPSRQCPVSGGTGRKRGSARGQMQKTSAGKFHGAPPLGRQSYPNSRRSRRGREFRFWLQPAVRCGAATSRLSGRTRRVAIDSTTAGKESRRAVLDRSQREMRRKMGRSGFERLRRRLTLGGADGKRLTGRTTACRRDQNRRHGRCVAGTRLGSDRQSGSGQTGRDGRSDRIRPARTQA
jgi:hypothetical protein